jgi:hypothetical protein
MDVLISDTGALWSPTGHELPRPPLLGPGAADAARRGGARTYVHMRLSPRGAWLRLHRGALSRAAFERLVWLLVQKQVDRAIIDFDDGVWAPELLTSLHDVVARLDEVRGEGPGEPPRPRFFLERLALERLDGHRRVALRRALASWGKARGRLNRSELDREIGSVNNDRILLRVQSGDRLQMDALTDVVGAYPPCERMRLLGLDIGEQPDRSFGTWLSEPYRVFTREAAPSLQLLEVALPSPNSSDVVRARYERLLLPWQSPGGDKWISTHALVRMRRVVSQ